MDQTYMIDTRMQQHHSQLQIPHQEHHIQHPHQQLHHMIQPMMTIQSVMPSTSTTMQPTVVVHVPPPAPIVHKHPAAPTKAPGPSNAGKNKGKRSRNPDNWLANVRKRQRQRGENYIDRTGQAHRARRVGAGCGTSCRLRCEKLLSTDDRQRVFDQFWALDDQQKWHFYAIYVERWQKARQRAKSSEAPAPESNNPRKKYSYVYFLQNKGGGRVRVCKTFFLSTLDISQKRLYFFYENVRTESGLPRAPLRGKVGSRATPETQLQQVRDHIRAFSRLEPPPGLTPAPGEEFLDAGISVRRMYELYREAYGSLSVKENVYRKVLKSDFNIKFIKPPTGP